MPRKAHGHAPGAPRARPQRRTRGARLCRRRPGLAHAGCDGVLRRDDRGDSLARHGATCWGDARPRAHLPRRPRGQRDDALALAARSAPHAEGPRTAAQGLADRMSPFTWIAIIAARWSGHAAAQLASPPK